MIKSHYELPAIKHVFFKKVQLVITGAIIIGFLVAGSIIYFRQYIDFKYQLESHGKVLSANLAFNAEKFIVEYDKNQLNELLDGVLTNSYVLFTGIINARLTEPAIDVLKKQSFIDLDFVAELIRYPNYGKIMAPKSMVVTSENEIGNVIFCISPITSNLQFPDDESTLLYGQNRMRAIIGYSVVAYKLPWDQILSVKIKWFLIVYLFVSILLGWGIGHILTNIWTKRLKFIHTSLSNYSFGDIISIQDPIQDEISNISDSISGLTEMVSVQLNKIKTINQTLESRVDERTIELKRLKDQLEKKHIFQRTFIAQITQELKILLNVIRDIEKGGGSTKLNQYFYDHIDQLVDLVIQVIRRKNELKMPLKLYAVSLNDIVQELTPIFKIMSQRKSNKLSITMADNLECLGDEIQLTQAIIQVMSNACKYTENGLVSLNITKDKDAIKISIVDSGIGMEQNHIDQILSTLDAGNLDQLDAFSNLGLGLLLVHQYFTNIGGAIQCKSKKDDGTTIALIHPIRNAEQQTEKSQQIICLSKSIETVRDWQLIIHRYGWEGVYMQSIKNYHYYNTNIVLMDIQSEHHVYEKLLTLRQIKEQKLLVLVFGGKGVLCSDIWIKSNDDKMQDIVESLIDNDARKVVFMDGFRDDEHERIAGKLSNMFNIKTKFSSSDAVNLKIVDQSKYFFKLTNTPLVLAINEVGELNDVIINKGKPVNDILKELCKPPLS